MSTDGGATWTRSWKPGNGEGPRRVDGTPVATEDGRLLIYSLVDGLTFASTDDGRTFTKSEPGLGGAVHWTRAGYLIYPVTENSTEFRLSTDGVHWREIKIG